MITMKRRDSYNQIEQHINTSSPLSPPVIDPRYLDNNFGHFSVLFIVCIDVVMHFRCRGHAPGPKIGIEYGTIPPLADNIANLVVPPTVLQTDEELIQ